ncbi:unnamed protein product [Brassica rapa subsp. narinosa]
MVENFGDGERRETFHFHLQYCKSFKHLPRFERANHGSHDIKTHVIKMATHPHALRQLHLLPRDHKIRRSLRAPISMSDVLSTTNHLGIGLLSLWVRVLCMIKKTLESCLFRISVCYCSTSTIGSITTPFYDQTSETVLPLHFFKRRQLLQTRGLHQHSHFS